MGFTDIHAHVLPGLDDGPIDVTASFALLHLFQQRDIDKVFCTSHYGHPLFDVSQSAIGEAYTSLQESRREASQESGVQLARGAEVRMTPSLVNDLRSGTVPTLGETRYVLIEFPGNEISEALLGLVHELCVRDYRPIVAHPERNIMIQKDVQVADTLLKMGAILQLTASCLFDEQSTDARSREPRVSNQVAWQLLSEGKAAVIASDAHNVSTRPPALKPAYDAVRSRLGDEVADLLIANAEAIWTGEPVHGMPRIPVQAPRKFSFFRRK